MPGLHPHLRGRSCLVQLYRRSTRPYLWLHYSALVLRSTQLPIAFDYPRVRCAHYSQKRVSCKTGEENRSHSYPREGQSRNQGHFLYLLQQNSCKTTEEEERRKKLRLLIRASRDLHSVLIFPVGNSLGVERIRDTFWAAVNGKRQIGHGSPQLV